MFTGLIDHLGHVHFVEKTPLGLRLGIASPFLDTRLGESIAVDGACLTVANQNTSLLWFDISPETANKTIIPSYRIEQLVHMERALCVGERLGGHFVSGHVDRTAIVHTNIHTDAFCTVQLGGFDDQDTMMLIEKGSITVNGISLTINAVLSNNRCECMIVPHTMKKTQLSRLLPGDRVNIEFDLITKIVARQINKITQEAKQNRK